MGLHRLLGHLPSEISEYRRYRNSVGELIEAHLAIEDVLHPIAAENVREVLSNLAPLKAGDEPLVDGHLLSATTDLAAGRRLGRLKEWLFSIQIEQDLDNPDEVLALLDVLDWKNTDPESWPDSNWP